MNRWSTLTRTIRRGSIHTHVIDHIHTHDTRLDTNTHDDEPYKLKVVSRTSSRW
jgi:hypothetical protein